MPRKKKAEAPPKPPDEVLEQAAKLFEIKEATIHDGFCNYKYTYAGGRTEGDSVARKGSNVVHGDMHNAFKKLDVHLAILDDVFLLKNIKVTDIDEVRDHEAVDTYHATAFKLSANGDSVIISGYKTVSAGIIDFPSPKVFLAGSSYEHSDDLETCLQDLVFEVEEYMGGKGEPRATQVVMEFNENEEM